MIRPWRSVFVAPHPAANGPFSLVGDGHDVAARPLPVSLELGRRPIDALTALTAQTPGSTRDNKELAAWFADLLAMAEGTNR